MIEKQAQYKREKNYSFFHYIDFNSLNYSYEKYDLLPLFNYFIDSKLISNVSSKFLIKFKCTKII